MNWKFTGDKPIYAQIIEHIQTSIATGAYPSGEGIPSVRVLALEAGVNPNTMQKALSELEAMGLLLTQRSSGRTVTDDGKLIENLKDNLARVQINGFFAGMKNLGFDEREAIGMLSGYLDEGLGPAKGSGGSDVVKKEVN